MKIKSKVISQDDINGLNDFVNTIFSKIQEYDLDKIFHVKKQFVGPLGEAMTLIKLYNEFGDNYKYEWYGTRKRDYDLIITKGDKLKKIQVKTSAADEWVFSINIKGFEDADEIRNNLRKGNFKLADEIIEKEVHNKNIDFWIFLHLTDGVFYVFDEKGIIKSIKCHYHKYVSERKLSKPNNYGIVEKLKKEQNYIRFMLNKRDLDNLWKDYMERWDLINL